MNLSPKLKELYQFLSNLKNAQEAEKVLKDLLTPQELNIISERLQILKNVAKGKPHREISKELGVSIGKVSRGSKVIQAGNWKWED